MDNVRLVGNANRDVTTDGNHIRVNHKAVFIGKDTVKELGLKEGDYIEFVIDRYGYVWIKKSCSNYGYKLKRVGQRLYTNNRHLAYEIALLVFAYPDDLYEGRIFTPFVLLTTPLTTDVEGKKCVEVFTSRIFRTRSYYKKLNQAQA